MRIRRGSLARGLLMLIFGKGGVGKTHLACSAPEPIVLSGEGGDFGCVARGVIEFDDYGRVIPRSWSEVIDTVRGFANAGALPEGGKTLVLEGFGAIEALCEKETLSKYRDKKKEKVQSIDDDWQGPHTLKYDLMRELVSLLQSLASRGINVIIVCHEERITTHDAETGDNVQIVPRLSSVKRGNIVALVTEACDIVGYLWQGRKADGEIGSGEHKKTIYTPTETRTLTIRPEGRAWLCKARTGLEHLSTNFIIPKPPTSGFDAIARQVSYAMLDEMKLRERLLALALPEERAAKLKAWLESNPSALDMRVMLIKEEQ